MIQQISQSSSLAFLQSIANFLKNSKNSNNKFISPIVITNLFAPFNNSPYSSDMQSLRGYCLQSIGKYELALFVYDEILARSPLHSSTLRRKAQLLAKIGRDNQGKELLQLASLLEPDNLHLQIVRMANMQKDDDESQQDNHEIYEAQTKEEQDEREQFEQTNSWKIKIRSIDGSVKHIHSAKSVLFKRQLEQEVLPKSCQALQPIMSKKSILKSKSYQAPVLVSLNNIESEQQDLIQKRSFNTDKIKSIDGKISISRSIQEKMKDDGNRNQNIVEKQIIFVADGDCKSCNHDQAQNNKEKENGQKEGKAVRRKSSLVMGKIASRKSDFR